MWSVLPTWAYPPSDPLHTHYYTANTGFCQIKKNFLDKCVFWVYNRISPPGLIYNIYRCRQLIPSDILWGFFYVLYKGRQNYLRMVLNQLKKNKNLSSVYTQMWVGGSGTSKPFVKVGLGFRGDDFSYNFSYSLHFLKIRNFHQYFQAKINI